MKIKIILAFVLLGFAKHSFGQNNCLNSNNNIGWHNYFGTFKVSENLVSTQNISFVETKLLQNGNRVYYV
jgi:hypothetical protein